MLTRVKKRLGDATRAGVRRSQELHLCSRAADGSNPAQGSQGTQGMGLGDRQEESPAVSMHLSMSVCLGTCELAEILPLASH